MAITTYSELQDAVSNRLARSTFADGGADVARTEEFIAMAEDRVYQDARLRVRALETTADLTINAQEVSLPTGYVAGRRIYISGNPSTKIAYLSPSDFWERWGSVTAGKPKFYTIEGENIVFGPSPDSTYTGKFLYYKRLDALSDSNTTNYWLTNARGLLLYGALIEAAVYFEDDAAALRYATLFDDEAERVQQADRKDRFSGSELVAETDIERT